MFHKLLKTESGYSLVEVMASIIILAIAIIPMVGMFDMGLHSATRGSNYDRARALANLEMEKAKSLSFAEVEDNFPEGTAYGDPAVWLPGPGEDFAGLDYRIEKQYMEQPPTDSEGDPVDLSGEEPFESSDTPTDLIRITVTVRWGDGNEYTTVGLVTSGEL